MDNLVLYLESLIFAAPQPVTRKDLRYTLENCFETKISEEDIESALSVLQEKYSADAFAIEVVEIGGGFQFMTKPAFHHVIGDYLKQVTRARLSRVALETLAIIAYKQPVSKSELEAIRGVNCDYAIQKLLEKELIEISGRSDGPGRPLLYMTSEKFMDHFGLKSIQDLPQLKEVQGQAQSIGEGSDVTEEFSRAPEEVSAEAEALSDDTGSDEEPQETPVEPIQEEEILLDTKH